MKITKYGHCCLLVEENGVRLLTDPGAYTVAAHGALTGIDIILFTHEHADHYHLDSLKQLLVGNPDAVIVCNEGVSALLQSENILHTTIVNGSHEHKGLTLTGISGLHEEVHASIPRIQNTGFMIGARLWYPGDSFINPKCSVDILALSVAGPWMKLSEAINYAIALAPKKSICVHDWILSDTGRAMTERIVGAILSSHQIALSNPELGKEMEF